MDSGTSRVAGELASYSDRVEGVFSSFLLPSVVAVDSAIADVVSNGGSGRMLGSKIWRPAQATMNQNDAWRFEKLAIPPG